MPSQYGGRLGNALVQQIERFLPQLPMFVIAHRGRNPYLKLGFVLSQQCPLDVYEDVLGAVNRRRVGTAL